MCRSPNPESRIVDRGSYIEKSAKEEPPLPSRWLGCCPQPTHRSHATPHARCYLCSRSARLVPSFPAPATGAAPAAATCCAAGLPGWCPCAQHLLLLLLPLPAAPCSSCCRNLLCSRSARLAPSCPAPAAAAALLPLPAAPCSSCCRYLLCSRSARLAPSCPAPAAAAATAAARCSMLQLLRLLVV